MSIFTSHTSIVERIRKIENREKYSHLVNSASKTEDEQKLYDNILKLNELIDKVKSPSPNDPVELFESGCRMLIPEIQHMLDKLDWE